MAYRSRLDQARASAEHYQRNRDATRARTIANKAAVLAEYRRTKEATPCTDCGLFFPFYVTQYDHIGTNKVDNVATLAANGSRKKMLVEIAKCELVCANCHAIRTHQRRSLVVANGSPAAP